MIKETDDLSWYARKAARAAAAAAGRKPDPAFAWKIEALLAELKAAGVRGDPASMTLYTRRLPPGCLGCLKGRGTNLYVTGLCTRDCFFCFNQKPRVDELVVHGLPVKSPAEAASIVERFRLSSVGISGGEPLLFPLRVLSIIGALKRLNPAPRVDLYTNGDRFEEKLLGRLKEAGLDSIRLNAASRDYDLAPLKMARALFEETTVEIPAIPADLERQKEMILELDAMDVPFLNLHELFVCAENRERMAREEVEAVAERRDHLLWSAVPESAAAALELLLFALKRAKRLSVYYCSCGTQDAISRRGLTRRRRLGLS